MIKFNTKGNNIAQLTLTQDFGAECPLNNILTDVTTSKPWFNEKNNLNEYDNLLNFIAQNWQLNTIYKKNDLIKDVEGWCVFPSAEYGYNDKQELINSLKDTLNNYNGKYVYLSTVSDNFITFMFINDKKSLTAAEEDFKTWIKGDVFDIKVEIVNTKIINGFEYKGVINKNIIGGIYLDGFSENYNDKDDHIKEIIANNLGIELLDRIEE